MRETVVDYNLFTVQEEGPMPHDARWRYDKFQLVPAVVKGQFRSAGPALGAHHILRHPADELLVVTDLYFGENLRLIDGLLVLVRAAFFAGYLVVTSVAKSYFQCPIAVWRGADYIGHIHCALRIRRLWHLPIGAADDSSPRDHRDQFSHIHVCMP